MKIEEKIQLAEDNIWKAISDYGAHTSHTRVLDNISGQFVTRLAKDSTYAKEELRNLFRTSPVWNEELDALVINGTRTHNPNYKRVYSLGNSILYPALINADVETENKILDAITFFSEPRKDPTQAIEAINEIAPNAYAPGKKPSRIFKAICDALHVSNNTAGSDFQRLYAQFADELSSKKIDFKLFVSLNPAHFLTMSNPKHDSRGDTLTSCHSFNSTEYQYNNGCIGYARDNVTFIAFVAADPDNPETLNNRKTMRQIFAYKPGNGLLLQSRLYNTSGGTYGAQEDSKLYRDLIQRELSALEHVPNMWKTCNYYGNDHCIINTGEGFGGYADWTYKDFDAKLSIRADHAGDFEPFTIGTYGLCIDCGCELDEWLYCDSCNDDDNEEECDECEEYFEETYPVYNNDGEEIYVCSYCRSRHYTYCEECGSYHPNDEMTLMPDGMCVCADCRAQLEAGREMSA